MSHPILLIHGLGASSRVWDRVVPLINQQAAVRAVDLTASKSIEADADLLAQAMTAPTVLVGHSRGALVATAIAERHPELAAAVVAVCPPWSVASRHASRKPAERILAIPAVGTIAWAAAGDGGRRRGLKRAYAHGVTVPDYAVEDLRRTGRAGFLRATTAVDRYLRAQPLNSRLVALGVPSTVIFGDADGRVLPPPPNTFKHQVAIPAGHTAPWESPRILSTLIAEAARNLTTTVAAPTEG